MGGAVLMITITDRSRGGEFAAWFQSQGIPLVLAAPGRGTATTEILDCLGLEATEKAVLMLAAPNSRRLVRRAAGAAGRPLPGLASVRRYDRTAACKAKGLYGGG